MNITTVFFDIDNTLVNHSKAEKKAFDAIRKKYFSKKSIKIFQKVWNEKSKKNWMLFESRQLTFDEQRTQRIIDVWKFFGKDISSKHAKEIFQEYLSFYEDFWELFPHVFSVIKRLNRMGLKLGIITNGNKEQQIYKIKQTGIYPFIEKHLIVISDEIGYSKPHKEIFLHSQTLAKENPKNILFVGDNMIQDIEPAVKLNWSTILIDHSSDSHAKNGTNDFRDLLNLVQ